MLYYSRQHVDLDRIDTAQLEKLKQFKASIRDRGIQADYSSVPELKQVLFRHLTIVMRDMSVAPKVDARTVRAAKASVGDDELSTGESEIPATKGSKSEPIRLENYTDRSFVVRRDSSALSEKLKALNGCWIRPSTGGKGWVFSKKRLADVAKVLKLKPVLVVSVTPTTP